MHDFSKYFQWRITSFSLCHTYFYVNPNVGPWRRGGKEASKRERCWLYTRIQLSSHGISSASAVHLRLSCETSRKVALNSLDSKVNARTGWRNGPIQSQWIAARMERPGQPQAHVVQSATCFLKCFQPSIRREAQGFDKHIHNTLTQKNWSLSMAWHKLKKAWPIRSEWTRCVSKKKKEKKNQQLLPTRTRRNNESQLVIFPPSPTLSPIPFSRFS